MTIESQLAEYQVYLLRFARLQLRNEALATHAASTLAELDAAVDRVKAAGVGVAVMQWATGGVASLAQARPDGLATAVPAMLPDVTWARDQPNSRTMKS